MNREISEEEIVQRVASSLRYCGISEDVVDTVRISISTFGKKIVRCCNETLFSVSDGQKYLIDCFVLESRIEKMINEVDLEERLKRSFVEHVIDGSPETTQIVGFYPFGTTKRIELNFTVCHGNENV